MKKSLFTLAALALLASGAAQADTLSKIKETGGATMGVRESSGALSYTLGDGKYAGFHYEVCTRVLADVQKKLGLAKMEVKYQPSPKVYDKAPDDSRTPMVAAPVSLILDSVSACAAPLVSRARAARVRRDFFIRIP